MTDAEGKKDRESREEKFIPTASSLGPEGKAIGQIGPYKLLRKLGEGGFGVVYLAQQERPVKRRVALKVIKPGMDSKQVIARFEAERQALALLDHPNIASVFNAGTTEAQRPYFVMEYVKGVPITEHCDREKLNVEERLKLFVQVCEAIGHAHQKGIIHRDIKPSNIQVSIEGKKAVPKIIDFGVAKAISQPLTERTLITEHGQLIGTPEYMSPEQAEMTNQDIDTRSDIYSLGVVLYELLAGALPFDKKTFRQAAFGEIQRIIREQDPPRPSTRLSSLGEEAEKVAQSRRTQVATLSKRLHKELEWIPLKAMRKERTHRYRSASELADDIQNYLDGNPLIAGPESAAYRLKKFLRRNRALVTGVATVLVVLVAGIVVSTILAVGQARARAQAEQAWEKEATARAQAEQAESIAQEQRELAEERAEEHRRALYFNYFAMADAAYQRGDISRVRKLLEPCPSDLRGWEWYRLNHISDQALMTLRGHSGMVIGVAVSPDGKYIASGSFDKTIKVWDAVTGAELTTLRGHEKAVGPVSFSPDGRRIASGSLDKTVKVWDWSTGAELMTLRGHHEGVAIGSRFSPDGRYIVSWGNQDKMIKIWDAESSEELAALRGGGPTSGISSIAFSPDSKRIVSGDRDKIIRVWDWATGDEPMMLHGHSEAVTSAAFSPDGKQIVSGSGDKTIRVWDWETGGEPMFLWGHDGGIKSAAFSPDGKLIVSASWDKTIKVWDAGTGEELINLRGGGWAYNAVFSPDGKRVITGSMDNTIKVWDLTLDREFLTMRGHKEMVLSLAFSPDGKRIVSGSRDKTIKVYDSISGAEVMTLPGHSGWVLSVVFTTDGKRIISNSKDGTIKVWDAVSGIELSSYWNPDGLSWSVSPSPDGKTVVYNSDDNILRIRDLSAETKVKTLFGHKRWPSCVAFSPDGKYIVSGDEYGMVKVWDVITASEVITLRRNRLWSYIDCIAFSPDGKRIVTGGDEVKVWNIEKGNEERTFQGHGGWVDSVVFSPDGKRIIGSCDNVKVWDVSTGAEILSLGGDKISGWTVAISPDGKTIATHGADNNIVLLESTVPDDGYKSRRTAQTAAKVVEQFYKELKSYHDVTSALQTDKSLDGFVRQLALQIARARLWEDADELNKESWEVVSLPDGDIESYQSALQKAKKANGFEPDNQSILNTLGIAQYRVGAYEEALVSLTNAGKIRADNHLESDHANLAFIAMTLYRLGQTEEARTSIEKLRGLFEEKESQDEKKLQAFLFEAEKLFAGENSKLNLVWECIEGGKLEEAVRLVEELRSSADQENIEINKQIEGAIKWLGRVYYNRAKSVGQSEKYPQVLENYEAIVAIDPEHAEALKELAWLRAICPVVEFRDNAKAVEYATKACELTEWKKHDHISILAAAYSETGDFEAAVKWQKKAVDLLGENERGKWQANYAQRLTLYESGKSYHKGGLWSFSEGELVAWWEFDKADGDKVTDSSGNGLGGKLVGGAKIVTDPERGDVLSLDGDGDYVDCGNDSAFSITGSITVACWIKVNAFDKEYQSIVARGILSWRIYREASTNNLSFVCYGLSNDTCTSVSRDVNDGKWHHVVGTYDGQKTCLYIDGNINNSMNATGLMNLDEENVYIGTINREVSSEFNGLIDDVRIYSYALNEAEVAAIYAGKEEVEEENE